MWFESTSSDEHLSRPAPCLPPAARAHSCHPVTRSVALALALVMSSGSRRRLRLRHTSQQSSSRRAQHISSVRSFWRCRQLWPSRFVVPGFEKRSAVVVATPGTSYVVGVAFDGSGVGPGSWFAVVPVFADPRNVSGVRCSCGSCAAWLLPVSTHRRTVRFMCTGHRMQV